MRTLLSEGTQITSPIGNQLISQSYVFSSNSTAILTPQDIIATDLDNQNGPDLVVALYSANAIALQRNDGAGKFDNQPLIIETPAGQGPIALVAADFNGMGLKDLAVANSLNQTISILLDLQGNRFTTTHTLSTAGLPTDIATADFDGDGDVDVWVLSRAVNQLGEIEVFLNDGQGGFQVGPRIQTQSKLPTSFVIADFNRDQLPDIAVTHIGDSARGNTGGDVRVILANAHANYRTPVAYPVGATPISLDASDLNGDGALDLAVVNFSVNTATILIGSAPGVFVVSSAELSVGSGPVQAALMDIDRDGDEDLLVANLRSKDVSILRNRFNRRQGSTTEVEFEPAESFGSAAFAVGPRLVFAGADFDRSGTIDLALINSESNLINVMTNGLIGGANRLTLNGAETIADQNFGLATIMLKPSMDSIPNVIHLLEDASALDVSLTGIHPGYSSGPPLQITALSSDESILQVQSVEYVGGASTGKLKVKGVADANGAVTVRVLLRNGGADQIAGNEDDGTSETTLSFSIDSVNDPPSVQLAGDRVITLGSPMRLVTGFASGFRSGGGIDETTQTIAEYVVSNDHPEWFIVQPHVDNQGVLRFQPGLTQTGVVNVHVQVRDSGGIERGGLDRSSLQSFKILITDLADGDIDFGDAPTATQSGFARSYPTRLQEDGARHRRSDLFLGSSVDPEPDGQPDAQALGDQTDLSDEDGVFWIAPPVSDPNIPTVASVLVIASGTSKLDAWLDLNQDGDWADSGEQILASASLVTGRNLLPVTIPAGTLVGKTFARFRVSTLGGLQPTGEAPDGEVEDYGVELKDGRVTQTIELSASRILGHQLTVRNGLLLITNSSGTVYAIPSASMDHVQVINEEGMVIYRVNVNDASQKGTVRFIETDQTVWFESSELEIDYEEVVSAVVGINGIVLSNPLPQVLSINHDPTTAGEERNEVVIQLGKNDQIRALVDFTLSALEMKEQGVEQTYLRNGAKLIVRSEAPFQNPFNLFDVDRDGQILPLDALLIINFINQNPSGQLPDWGAVTILSLSFIDLDGNNQIEPLDVLLLINHLNARGG